MFYVMIDTASEWGYDVESLFTGSFDACTAFITSTEWDTDEHPWIENESGEVIE